MEIFLASLIGVLAGLSSGLFGVGGGVVMTPLLFLWFESTGQEALEATLNALATSIAAILFTSIASMTTHAFHKSIRWMYTKWLIPASLFGAAVSAYVAQFLPAVLLIGLLVSYLGFSSWKISRSTLITKEDKTVRTLSNMTLTVIGFFAGLLGPITGTGGGIVVSTTLSNLGQPLIMAIGTSAAVLFGVAVTGTIVFSAGPGEISQNALIGLAPTCLIFASIGARFANRVNLNVLKRIYAIFLAVMAMRLCWSLVGIT